MTCLRSASVVGTSRVWLTVGLVFSLTAALLMGSAAPAGAVAGYGDVPDSSWYTNAVQWSTDNTITGIAGSCFGPETPVSRGETAVWIYNMENQPDAGEPHSFTDVTDESQHDAVSWMANNEITTGTSPTTFAPDDTLRRAQVAAFLHRLAGEPSAPPHGFVDVVAAWQQEPVSWMAHTGITTGTSPNTFAPEDALTRAQLVTFLYRYQGEPDVTLNTTTPDCAPTFKSVSAGGQHSCAVRSDDTAVCWGNNGSGRADAPTGGFKSVSAGGYHSCAVRSDDTAVCWDTTGLGRLTRRQVVSNLSAQAAQAAAIVAPYAATTLPSAGDTTGLGGPTRRQVVSKQSAQAAAIVAPYAATTQPYAGDRTMMGRLTRRQVGSKQSAQAAAIVAPYAATTQPYAGDTTGLGRLTRRQVGSKQSAQAAAIVAPYAATTQPYAGETTGLGRLTRRQVISKQSAQAVDIVAEYAATTLPHAGETTEYGQADALTGGFKSVSAGDSP